MGSVDNEQTIRVSLFLQTPSLASQLPRGWWLFTKSWNTTNGSWLASDEARADADDQEY
jgi:hypothetical protein